MHASHNRLPVGPCCQAQSCAPLSLARGPAAPHEAAQLRHAKDRKHGAREREARGGAVTAKASIRVHASCLAASLCWRDAAAARAGARRRTLCQTGTVPRLRRSGLPPHLPPGGSCASRRSTALHPGMQPHAVMAIRQRVGCRDACTVATTLRGHLRHTPQKDRTISARRVCKDMHSC